MKRASDDHAILSFFLKMTYFISVPKISLVWPPLHTLLTFHLNFSSILLAINQCDYKQLRQFMKQTNNI